MAMISAMASALAGMKAAWAGLDRTATRIARAADDPGQLPDELVALRTSEHAAKANAAVVRTADAVTGTTLDLLG